MSVNLSMATIWENETCLLIIRDSTVQRRLAMSTTQVCIWMAFHALTVEKVQGKVLFELFIKGFDCLSTLVDFG